MAYGARGQAARLSHYPSCTFTAWCAVCVCVSVCVSHTHIFDHLSHGQFVLQCVSV